MEFIPGVTAVDLPDPPHVDEVVRTFAGRRMRCPVLWEAVRTTRVPPTGRAEHEEPDAVLVNRVNHILTNAFRAERVRVEHAHRVSGSTPTLT